VAHRSVVSIGDIRTKAAQSKPQPPGHLPCIARPASTTQRDGNAAAISHDGAAFGEPVRGPTGPGQAHERQLLHPKLTALHPQLSHRRPRVRYLKSRLSSLADFGATAPSHVGRTATGQHPPHFPARAACSLPVHLRGKTESPTGGSLPRRTYPRAHASRETRVGTGHPAECSHRRSSFTLLLPSFAGPRLFRIALRFRGHLEGGVSPSAMPAKPQNGAALRDHPAKAGSSSVKAPPQPMPRHTRRFRSASDLPVGDVSRGLASNPVRL